MPVQAFSCDGERHDDVVGHRARSGDVQQLPAAHKLVFEPGQPPRIERWWQLTFEPKLKIMALIKLSRLSVQPVTDAEWTTICKLGGIKP